jgi:spore coat polysaccharide biosynthesis protein SpsF
VERKPLPEKTPRVVAVIQARVTSTRLPGKVLKEVIPGLTMIGAILERATFAKELAATVVAIPEGPLQDELGKEVERLNGIVFRGPEEDVLARYVMAGRAHKADHVVRITSDCPLFSWEETDRLIRHHLETAADYSHNVTVWGSRMPLGTGSEVFTLKSLEVSAAEGHAPHHREHVDEYIYEHRDRFRFERLLAPTKLDRPTLRLTVDEQADLELMRRVYAELYRPGHPIPLEAAVDLLDREPSWRGINAHVHQKTI